MGGGRKSIEKLFPDIINKTEEILKEHGFSADSKRRTDTVRSSGVTLEQIKNKLLYEIPLLKDHVLHETTVHRLLSSPNKIFKASTSYKSEVDAKVPPKRNDDRIEDENAHLYAARVQYTTEFASKFEKECISLSCDNKNKIHIGTQAVSRYHQL